MAVCGLSRIGLHLGAMKTIISDENLPPILQMRQVCFLHSLLGALSGECFTLRRALKICTDFHHTILLVFCPEIKKLHPLQRAPLSLVKTTCLPAKPYGQGCKYISRNMSMWYTVESEILC